MRTPTIPKKKKKPSQQQKSQRREEGNPQKFEKEISKIAQKSKKRLSRRIRQQYLKRICKIDNIHNTYRRLHNLSN